MASKMRPKTQTKTFMDIALNDRQAELPIRDTCSLRGADEALRQALQAEQLLGGQHATLPQRRVADPVTVLPRSAYASSTGLC